MMQREIKLYVIYERPRDYPTEFVVRIHRIRDGAPEADQDLFARGWTLDDVRRMLPRGPLNVGRHGVDEPQIREVWL